MRISKGRVREPLPDWLSDTFSTLEKQNPLRTLIPLSYHPLTKERTKGSPNTPEQALQGVLSSPSSSRVPLQHPEEDCDVFAFDPSRQIDPSSDSPSYFFQQDRAKTFEHQTHPVVTSSPCNSFTQDDPYHLTSNPPPFDVQFSQIAAIHDQSPSSFNTTRPGSDSPHLSTNWGATRVEVNYADDPVYVPSDPPDPPMFTHSISPLQACNHFLDACTLTPGQGLYSTPGPAWLSACYANHESPVTSPASADNNYSLHKFSDPSHDSMAYYSTH
jgi:hypothetical protein